MAQVIDIAVTNTDSAERYLLDVVGLPSSKIVNAIYEVADRKAMSSTRIRLEESLPRPVFLFVGRLVKGKGVHVLLESVRRLRDKGHRSFTVLLAGSGAQEGELRLLGDSFQLADSIRWLGPMPFDSLGALYETCDALILPSLEDTWGVVVMEAMAFGKPVICSRSAGVSRVVREGINGLLVDPTRPEELADAMERLIRDRRMIRELGKNALWTAREYTPEAGAKVLASSILLAVRRNEKAQPS